METAILSIIEGAPNFAIAAYVVYKQFSVVESLTSALIKCIEHCPDANE